jgi:putative hydrolase of the HAD superfamily
MAVDAVIFDWGGTLSVWAQIDLEDMWRLAARRLAPDRQQDMMDRLLAVEARVWRRVEQTQRSATLSEVLEAAGRDLGLDVTEVVLQEAATHHLDAWTPHITHDPEAVPVIRALRDRGVRIGLLSNTLWPREFHDRFLERDGLLDLFDARLYTSHMERTKPHVSAFHAALEAVGVKEPSRAVFVGDRPFDDIYGAKSTGLRAVLRPNDALPAGFTLIDQEPVEPDAVIHSLPELLTLVDAWSVGEQPP